MKKVFLISILIILNSCITQFIPKTNEDKKILVVDGLLTDLPGPDTIKLSESQPLGLKNTSNPVRGCIVTISDNAGNTFNLAEDASGTYVTNPSEFQGVIGRSYTLHITGGSLNNNHFESYPMELKSVPPIDTLYYEKVTLAEVGGTSTAEGCQIYFNTHDPTNQTKYYRWTYTETWKIILPYNDALNKICWVTGKSDQINIKNTSVIGEARIDRYPINFISNLTDRLRVKYSILLKQYSINEDEYLYWEKLQNVSEQIGGLYDMIPSSITGNVYCLDDPDIKVLGYFSVSACKTKRLFIGGGFAGTVTPYTDSFCILDTVFGGAPIISLGTFVWIIVDHGIPPPSYRVTTRQKGCYDCTTRGTKIKPDFWIGDK
jgi:hypothetical protein